MIVTDLVDTFAIAPVDVAALLSALLFTILLVQLPAGFVVNHLGPRWALSLAAAVCGGGLVLFAMANGFAVALAARILIGAGAAFSLVGSATLAANWLPRHLFALALGAIQAATMAVTIVGNLLFARLVELLGWRQAVLALGAGNVGLALLLWLVVRDAPAGHPQSVQASGHRGKRVALADLLPILRNPQSWLQGFFEACAYGPIVAVTGLWEIAQLRADYHLSLTAATAVDDLAYVGFAIGAPVFGVLSAYWQRRRALMIAAGAGLTVCYVVPVLVPSMPLLLDSLRLWVVGFFASSNVLAFATAKDLYPARVKELIVVFVNLVGIIGTMILPVLIGWFLTLHDALPGVYTAADYALALNLVLPACGVLALLAALGTRETLGPHTSGNDAPSDP